MLLDNFFISFISLIYDILVLCRILSLILLHYRFQTPCKINRFLLFRVWWIHWMSVVDEAELTSMLLLQRSFSLEIWRRRTIFSIILGKGIKTLKISVLSHNRNFIFYIYNAAVMVRLKNNISSEVFAGTYPDITLLFLGLFF